MKPGASRPQSLLAVLARRVGLLFLAIVLAVGLVAYFTAQDRIDEVYDGQLIISANVLRALVSDEVREEAQAGSRQLQIDDTVLLSAEDRDAFNDYADWRMFRVWRGGRIVLSSDTGPPGGAPPLANGFSEVEGPAERWRTYTLHVPNSSVVVQVGERTDIRLVLVRRMALGLVLPLLLLIPTSAALIWLTLNGGLRALRALVAEIQRRSVRDLTPLSLTAWPRDLHPLVGSINRLLERIERSLQGERRFLDDAAHQLRTPLAAVKLQAQSIARANDPAERQALTAQLLASVDRASDLTDGLLTLARLESRGAEFGGAGDLRVETVAAMADLAAVAARRGVNLAFEGEGDFPNGDSMLLRLIAANLVENAIAYSPAGGEVLVRLSRRETGQTLSVVDSGPGIAPEERRKVLERFYRGPDAVAVGSGLGLAIVDQAVRLLGGRLALEERGDGMSGLRAVVDLPAN